MELLPESRNGFGGSGWVRENSSGIQEVPKLAREAGLDAVTENDIVKLIDDWKEKGKGHTEELANLAQQKRGEGEREQRGTGVFCEDNNDKKN